MTDPQRTHADQMEEYLLNLTRRRFFGRMAGTIGAGLGGLALAGISGRANAAAAGAGPGVLGGPGVVPAAGAHAAGPHFAPKAKRVIYLHMEGAPSQLDLYDHKPQLQERFDQDLPDSIRNGQRITTMTSGQTRFPVAPSVFRFDRHENNQDGVYLSELLPFTGGVAKDLCFVHSMHTQAINHEPGITFFQTGSEQPGRASFG
ncbi:MAG: DUF1501 domain-containing protein, partial [Planctomycetota bacterium]